MREIIGKLDVGPVSFPVFDRLQYTLSSALRRAVETVLAAGRILASENGAETNPAATTLPEAEERLRRALTDHWYELTGRPWPGSPEHRAERREAQEEHLARLREEARRLPEEPTGADVIRAGLLDGKGTSEILEDLDRLCPTYNGNSSHVGYYRHQLRKQGLLPWPEGHPNREDEEDE